MVFQQQECRWQPVVGVLAIHDDVVVELRLQLLLRYVLQVGVDQQILAPDHSCQWKFTQQSPLKDECCVPVQDVWYLFASHFEEWAN
jgi:hypothetical protein